MTAPQRVVIIVPMNAMLEARHRPQAQAGHSLGWARLTGALLIAQGALLIAAVGSTIDSPNSSPVETVVWAALLASPSIALGAAFAAGRSPRRTAFTVEIALVFLVAPMLWAYSAEVATHDLTMKAPADLLVSAAAVIVTLVKCGRTRTGGLSQGPAATTEHVDGTTNMRDEALGRPAADELNQAERPMRRLRRVAVLAAILMVAAAVTQASGYVLYSLETPREALGTFWAAILIGAIPGVTTAGAIVRAIRRRDNPRGTILRLRISAAVGLPFIFVGGALSGFGLAFLDPPSGSPAALAASVYVVTFLAAVLGDIVLLVVALFTRPPARSPFVR
ncbi:MAG TPA: hypothetical protein VI316_12675 [Candidatus Dormibacteraeota bacterium]